MARRSAHPRITPVRALVLLRTVDTALGCADVGGTGRRVLAQVAEELFQHVLAGLAKGRR